MNPDWTKITLKRNWCSTTPETFRYTLAGWAWAKQHSMLSETDRPQLEKGKLSQLLVNGIIVVGPAGEFGLCLGEAKWGGLVLPLIQIRTDDPWTFKIGWKISKADRGNESHVRAKDIEVTVYGVGLSAVDGGDCGEC